jgi:hypothetical protein
MEMNKNLKRRKHIRFSPDANTTIWISKNTKAFQRDFLGLVDGESHGGTAFTVNQDMGIKEGDFILVQVGQMNSMMAEVRWMKKFRDDLFQFGLMYLE